MKRVFLLWMVFCSFPAAAFAQEAAAGQAPALVLKDLGGRSVRLSDYRGRVVLLNFWATWCAPCRAEMPELVAWQKQYGPRGLRIVGVTQPPFRRASVRRLARRLRLNYPVVVGESSSARLLGVGGILPETIIVDREGRIRDRILGIIEPEEFEEKIEPLLGGGSRARRKRGIIRDSFPRVKS